MLSHFFDNKNSGFPNVISSTCILINGMSSDDDAGDIPQSVAKVV